jgi:hypothetical protein
MDTYKIIRKGVFESKSKFEERLNALVLEGWKAISIASDQGTLSVLLEKNR